MTVNVNVEKVGEQKLSIDEAEGGNKSVQINIGKISRDNDLNSSKAERKVFLKILQKKTTL